MGPGRLAQVVGLAQARLQKRQPPEGPSAILPLGHCTSAENAGKRSHKEPILKKEKKYVH